MAEIPILVVIMFAPLVIPPTVIPTITIVGGIVLQMSVVMLTTIRLAATPLHLTHAILARLNGSVMCFQTIVSGIVLLMHVSLEAGLTSVRLVSTVHSVTLNSPATVEKTATGNHIRSRMERTASRCPRNISMRGG